MKIIEHGKLDKQTRRFTCGACGCVFEADKTEYIRRADSTNGLYCVMICPECGQRAYCADEAIKEEFDVWRLLDPETIQVNL